MRLTLYGDGGALPLPHLRGRAGVGVFPQNARPEGTDLPHPPRSCERVNLPRKRER